MEHALRIDVHAVGVDHGEVVLHALVAGHLGQFCRNPGKGIEVVSVSYNGLIPPFQIWTHGLETVIVISG